MKIATVVQARMTSRRLPGKILRPMRGRPMLAYTLDRVERARGAGEVIVATSTDASDEPLVAFCGERGVRVFRGDLLDVASRFSAIFDASELDAIVRISGDSPLLDPALIDRAVALLRERRPRPDLVTNVLPRTFPHGESVEVLVREGFARAYAMMSEPAQFEHVTPIYYQRPEAFDIVGFTRAVDVHTLRLVVDDERDWRVVEAILERMDRPHWDYGLDEVLKLHRRVTAGAGPEAAA